MRGSTPRFSPLEYRDPAPAPWLIALMTGVNRQLILGALMKLRRFDLPAADLERLRRAVNPGTAAFLGPAHPEFLTDWMVDKEVSARCSPLMAHWASYEIVNASPLVRAFWLANNLIANVPGGGGKAYSVQWARRGHGVLLHPEGTATWQGERVSPLLPGLVDMAWTAAEAGAAANDGREVWLVPLVWQLRFVRDARAGLAREITHIEHALALPVSRGPLETRFGELLCRLLVRQCARLGLASPEHVLALGPSHYFAAQHSVLEQLQASLAERYGPLDADVTRAQFQIRKAMRERGHSDPDAVRLDRARLLELQRLTGLDPRLYDRPELAQERIAEILKRTRSSLLTHGFANVLANTVPVAVAPRTVHVRVAEPIAVHTVFGSRRMTSPEDARAALLAEHARRLQHTLDRLGVELASQAGPPAVGNPVCSTR
ncbi:MAG: hypothetical protein ABL977_05240 [Candidatus Eisenbacteria bacterium]